MKKGDGRDATRVRRWLPLKVVAHAVGLSTRVLRVMSTEGRFPPIIQASARTYLVAEDDVVRWQEQELRKAEAVPARIRFVRSAFTKEKELPAFLRWQRATDYER